MQIHLSPFRCQLFHSFIVYYFLLVSSQWRKVVTVVSFDPDKLIHISFLDFLPGELTGELFVTILLLLTWRSMTKSGCLSSMDRFRRWGLPWSVSFLTPSSRSLSSSEHFLAPILSAEVKLLSKYAEELLWQLSVREDRVEWSVSEPLPTNSSITWKV